LQVLIARDVRPSHFNREIRRYNGVINAQLREEGDGSHDHGHVA
jgi:hypothetical protein